MVRNILLVSFLITLFSCTGFTPQEKAEHSVDAYMQTYLDFPKSYEGIEFEKLEKDGRGWHISHLYRAKNKKNEITVAQRVFFLDTLYHIKKVMTLKEYSDLTISKE